MKSFKILEDNGIHLRNHSIGTQKVLCKCSSTRRNKTERCLSVTITPDAVLFHCHHCGWSGGAAPEKVKPKRDKQAEWKKTIKRGW